MMGCSVANNQRLNNEDHEDGYCEVLDTAEGMKEDKTSWRSFFQWPRRVAGTQWGKKKYMDMMRLKDSTGVRMR